jgi:hypothetical protein
MTRAEDDGSRIGTKPASTAHITRSAQYVRRRHFAARQLEMLEHENHGRACVLKLKSSYGSKNPGLTVFHEVLLCLLTTPRLESTEVLHPLFFSDAKTSD